LVSRRCNGTIRARSKSICRWVSSASTGSLPGILIGSYIATRLPDLLLRPVLATTLILVGGRLLS
jgi:uncharacterized membrane protein YfcA